MDGGGVGRADKKNLGQKDFFFFHHYWTFPVSHKGKEGKRKGESKRMGGERPEASGPIW